MFLAVTLGPCYSYGTNNLRELNSLLRYDCIALQLPYRHT